jgi:hypothetical protein
MIAESSMAAEDEAVNLEVHEWSVWIAEPQGKQMNSASDFPTAMPGLVESERSRKIDSEKPKPAPLSLMTIYGTPPEVADVDLRMTAGRPISQWPRSDGKSNRLRWLDLKLSKELSNPELIAYIPETHWFHRARALEGLYIHVKSGKRAERFLAYDLELQSPLNVRLDGNPEQYRLVNLGKHPVHDVLLIVPGADGPRLGWLDTVTQTPGADASPDGKPAAAANTQPQQPAQATVTAVAGAVQVVAAAPAQATPAAATTTNAAADAAKTETKLADTKPVVKAIGTEIPLSGPLAVDSDEFLQKTDTEMRRRLLASGLKEGEVSLLMSLYAQHFFKTDEIHLVFRLSQPGIDDVTPLTIEPDTTKIKRVALVIAKKVDPRLREDVQKLVEELADPSYAKREEAEKRLKKLGNLAIPSLKEAMKSKDLEVVMRAERLLLGHKEQLGNDPTPAQ